MRDHDVMVRRIVDESLAQVRLEARVRELTAAGIEHAPHLAGWVSFRLAMARLQRDRRVLP